MRKLFLGAALLVVLGCGGGGEVASIVQPPPTPDYELRFEPGVDPMNLTAGVEYRLFTVRKTTGQPRNGAHFQGSTATPGASISFRSSDGTGMTDGESFMTCTAPLTGQVWIKVDGKEIEHKDVKAIP